MRVIGYWVERLAATLRVGDLLLEYPRKRLVLEVRPKEPRGGRARVVIVTRGDEGLRFRTTYAHITVLVWLPAH